MKKLLSIILAFALTACLLPGCKGKGHSHCLCGGGLSGHGCESRQWTELKQEHFDDVTADSSPVSLHNNVYRLTAGSYYLSEEIVTREQILIIKDAVNLCLNGFRFAGTYSERTGVYSRIFAVSGGTLNISDCTGKGNIQGGYADSAAAILVQGSSGGAEGELGTVNLYSGTVKGGRAQKGRGGTVSITGGTMNVYGGEITGGAAQSQGGTIFVAAGQYLNLYGGVIGDGSASYGKCVYAEQGSFVKLSGTAAVGEIYLPANTLITVEATDSPGFKAAIAMETAGVFAQEVSVDCSASFTGGTVKYDPVSKTLSIE